MRSLHQIPVSPGLGDQTLDSAREHIKAGRSVAIFPEGLISPHEGGSHKARSGAARLALGSGIPVIPVGISLQREKSLRITSGISGKKTTAWWYLHGPYMVTVGKPIRFEGNCQDREQVNHITTQLMASINGLAIESENRLQKFLLKRLPEN